MKKTIIAALTTTIMHATYLSAANIQINDVNIKFEGGISASAMYFENPGFLKRHDSYLLNDALLEISPETRKDKQFQFYAGVGVLQKQTIDRIYAPLPPVDIALHYGWLEVPTYNNHFIEIGQLVSKLGHESSISYKNPHALMGAVYSAQPDFYPGVRFIGPIGGLNYYVEVTNDNTIGDASAAGGIYYNSEKSNFSISYYDAISERKMIDLVYARFFEVFSLGINLDYHMLNDPAPKQDDDATGVALFMNYRVREWDWPLRFEYISDGNTGIYQYDKGYTVTFSPTYRFNDAQFIRAELITAQADGKPFRHEDGSFKEDQFIATLQVGLVF